MAERRMFAKTIIDSDAFLDMPLSTQALYFHLNMRADDEGFVNNPKKIQRMIGCSDDDMKLLVAKNFIIHFDTGVIVIKHWKMHNYIQKDRFKPTVYQEEKASLSMKPNGAYTLEPHESEPMYTECIQDVSILDTQDRLGKDSLGKVSKGKSNTFVRPTLEEVQTYCNERGNGIDPQAFIDYYDSNGWMVGKNHMKDWKAAVRNWEHKNYDRKGSEKKTNNVFLELLTEEYGNES